MKKTLLFKFITSSVGLFSQQNLKTEKEKIKNAIYDYYHEGHAQNSGELYKDILHKKWKIMWINEEGNIESTDKKTYMSWYKPENIDKALKWKTKIYYIDISRNIGSAKIKITNQEFGYIDYFNLMKEDNKWWIVNKISRSLVNEK
jgi:aldose sugar dehydrogenase